MVQTKILQLILDVMVRIICTTILFIDINVLTIPTKEFPAISNLNSSTKLHHVNDHLTKTCPVSKIPFVWEVCMYKCVDMCVYVRSCTHEHTMCSYVCITVCVSVCTCYVCVCPLATNN